MADSIVASKRFETPIFDSLVPKKQDLVIAYTELLDKNKATEAAGYSNNNHQFKATVKKLFTDPIIIAAIDEYLEAKLDQLDSGRAAVCQKLLSQSLAEIYDVCQQVPFVNAHGKTAEGKTMLEPLPVADVEPRFRCAMSFAKRNRDGQYEWDNNAQHRATTQLSKLMMWDQSLLDQNPALVFQFGDIQQNEYVPPSNEVDTSVVDTGGGDEVDALIKH